MQGICAPLGWTTLVSFNQESVLRSRPFALFVAVLGCVPHALRFRLFATAPFFCTGSKCWLTLVFVLDIGFALFT